jgi:hypothetical protein
MIPANCFSLALILNSLAQKERMANNMEEKKKIIVVAKAGAIEIVVEGDKDEDVYELLLSKPQATNLALDILNTIYKTGEKF